MRREQGQGCDFKDEPLQVTGALEPAVKAPRGPLVRLLGSKLSRVARRDTHKPCVPLTGFSFRVIFRSRWFQIHWPGSPRYLPGIVPSCHTGCVLTMGSSHFSGCQLTPSPVYSASSRSCLKLHPNAFFRKTFLRSLPQITPRAMLLQLCSRLSFNKTLFISPGITHSGRV